MDEPTIRELLVLVGEAQELAQKVVQSPELFEGDLTAKLTMLESRLGSLLPPIRGTLKLPLDIAALGR